MGTAGQSAGWHVLPPWSTSSLGPLVLRRARVPAEQPRRRELAELVAHHVLRHVHGYELVPVMHGERVAHELGKYRARTRPRLHDPLLVARVHRLDPAPQAVLNERSLLYASRHWSVPVSASHHLVALPRFRPRTISRCDGFFLLRVF